MLRGVKESKVKLILLYDAYNNSDLAWERGKKSSAHM